MSKTEESPSASDSDDRASARPKRGFRRDAWRELNSVQLVLIATGAVAGLFGLFGGLLILLSALMSWGGIATGPIMGTAAIPSWVALGCAAGAVLFTRSPLARRAAREESGPAVLMALTGLLGIAIAWLIS